MTLVTSDKKISSNRENAKKSSGPKSVDGKAEPLETRRVTELAIPVGAIAALRGDFETLALSIARASGAYRIVAVSGRSPA
jgi:hypothetical protein